LLKAAAVKIGAAAGAMVSLTGAHQTDTQAKLTRARGKGKLVNKDKTRLPRRAKKASRKKSSG